MSQRPGTQQVKQRIGMSQQKIGSARQNGPQNERFAATTSSTENIVLTDPAHQTFFEHKSRKSQQQIRMGNQEDSKPRPNIAHSVR